MSSDESVEPIEWDMMNNPFTTLGTLHVHHGSVDIPHGHDTGLAIDEEMLRHYRWEGSSY